MTFRRLLRHDRFTSQHSIFIFFLQISATAPLISSDSEVSNQLLTIFDFYMAHIGSLFHAQLLWAFPALVRSALLFTLSCTITSPKSKFRLRKNRELTLDERSRLSQRLLVCILFMSFTWGFIAFCPVWHPVPGTRTFYEFSISSRVCNDGWLHILRVLRDRLRRHTVSMSGSFDPGPFAVVSSEKTQNVFDP